MALRALIATEESTPYAIRIEERGHGLHFDARLEEVHPELGTGVRLRLAMWADRIVAKLLEGIERRARAARQGAGSTVTVDRTEFAMKHSWCDFS